MANLNVALLGTLDYAQHLGKRGTASDLTFYNLKKGENIVTFVEPTRYPERLAPLFYAISLATKSILVVDQINKAFAECVVMLHCADLKDGLIILRNNIRKEQIAPLISGTVVEGYQFIEDDKSALREMLLEEASHLQNACDSKAGTMPVDHFYNVKGVGIVVLGCIKEGTLRKHDELRVLPGDKTAQIRSIQKHDDDFDCAGIGDRVGLALKGIGLDDLERGTVITNNGSVKMASSLKGKSEITKYWPTPLNEVMVLHIGNWMQFLPARLESIRSIDDWHNLDMSLTLDKPLIYKPGSRGVLTYPEGSKLRVIGNIELL
jgi:selenocysteine-specific translation elongation factor